MPVTCAGDVLDLYDLVPGTHASSPIGAAAEALLALLSSSALTANEPERAPYLGDPWYLELLETERWRPEHVPKAMQRRRTGRGTSGSTVGRGKSPTSGRPTRSA